MTILFVNKFLFPRGGDFVYMHALAQGLQQMGHEVHYFGMQHPDNVVARGEEKFLPRWMDFNDLHRGEQLEAVARLFGVGEVRRLMCKALNQWKPQVVVLNNIHSYLSPIVAQLAKQRGCRVIWTLHDYKLLCPTYLLRCQGERCEACLTRPSAVIARKCMKESLPASVLAWAESTFWSKKRLSEWTDLFICPSRFLHGMMLKAGFKEEQLCVLPNFVSHEKAAFIRNIGGREREEGAYAYIGRLSEEKGIEPLLRVASNLPYKLYIAGSGPLEEELRKKYTAPNILFLGKIAAEEVIRLMKRVHFCVAPSVCPDNCPLSVLESMACGTPVLGRRVGGIPDLLTASSLNRLFETDAEMASGIHELFTQSLSIPEREVLSCETLQHFSAERYLQTYLPLLTDI